LEEQAGLEVEKRLSKYVMKKSAISPGVEIIFPWISWMCKTTFPFPFNNSLLEELGGVITINCPELFRSLLVVFCDLI